MRCRLVLVLLISATFVHPAAWAGPAPLPTAMPESVGLSSTRLQRLAEAIRRDVEQGRMPGAVVAIARRGKLVYHEAFGFVDKAANAPMPKDAIFALASMTKPMAAVATLMLAEQGDLLLNDPASNYLPALKDMKVATATGTEPRAPAADAPGHAASHSRRQLRQPRRHPAAQAVLQPAAERGWPDQCTVPRRARQAAIALPAGDGLGLQSRARRGRSRGRGGHEETPRRIPPGAAVRTARHGGHRVRGAGVESRADREAAADRSGDRPSGGVSRAGEAMAVPTAAVAARRERPSTTSDSPRCSSTTERSTGRAS